MTASTALQLPSSQKISTKPTMCLVDFVPAQFGNDFFLKDEVKVKSQLLGAL